MNLADYIDKNLKSLSRKKKKNLIRKVNNKLRSIQPKILEAKILSFSKDNKIFMYRDRLEASLLTLKQELNL